MIKSHDFYLNPQGKLFRTDALHYVVCVDKADDTVGFLCSNGKFEQSMMRTGHITSWVPVHGMQAYKLLGLPTTRYFFSPSGQPFGGFGLRMYAVTFKIDDSEYGFLYSDGSYKRGNGCYSLEDHPQNWVEVDEKTALSVLQPKPQYDFTELEAAFARIDENKKIKAALTIGERLLQLTPLQPKKDEISPLLYRHLRYYHDGEVCGGGGVTIGVRINHTKGTLTVYPAVCSKANTFSKGTSHDIISFRRSRLQGITIKYNESASIVDNVARAVMTDQYTVLDGCIGKSDFLVVLEKFKEALMAGVA